jgi:hypothetical protein
LLSGTLTRTQIGYKLATDGTWRSPRSSSTRLRPLALLNAGPDPDGCFDFFTSTLAEPLRDLTAPS